MVQNNHGTCIRKKNPHQKDAKHTVVIDNCTREPPLKREYTKKLSLELKINPKKRGYIVLQSRPSKLRWKSNRLPMGEFCLTQLVMMRKSPNFRWLSLLLQKTGVVPLQAKDLFPSHFQILLFNDNVGVIQWLFRCRKAGTSR